MKITILNGDINNTNSDFTMYLNKLEEKLKKENEVVKFDLKSMNLKYCTGCWSCWWRTPGLCAIKDDGEEIFRTIINSDFVIFASPLVAGFISSGLKKVKAGLVGLLELNRVTKD